MKKQIDVKTLFIRFAYWLGAIMDLLVAGSMFLYVFFELNIGMGFPVATVETKFMLIAGMALMIGWTVLLIWGDRKPIERRHILLITAFPVVFIYLLGELIVYLLGESIQTLNELILFQIIRSVLIIIFVIAFILAEKQHRKKKDSQ